MLRTYFQIPQTKSRIHPPSANSGGLGEMKFDCPKCASATHIHGHKARKICDPKISAALQMRRQCKLCDRTFTVRPEGITKARATNRTKAIALVWYMLGLSYDGVTIALETLGMSFCKTAVYYWVQSMWDRIKDMRRRIKYGKVRFAGLDGTIYKVCGQHVPVQFLTDLISGETIEIIFQDEEDALAMEALIRDIKGKFGVEMITTDDAPSYRKAAEEAAMPQQLCLSHAKKSLVNRCKKILLQAKDERYSNIEQIEHLTDELKDKAKQENRAVLEVGKQIYLRFRGAKPPGEGEKATVDYRMYLLGLNVMDQWHRIFTDVPYRNEFGLDGTNNATERAIGLTGKIRYKTMRGFKRKRNLKRYIEVGAWLRHEQKKVGLDGFIDLIPVFAN